jgi:hypothetical protein
MSAPGDPECAVIAARGTDTDSDIIDLGAGNGVKLTHAMPASA